MNHKLVGFLIFLASILSTQASADFQVNTYTTDYQSSPALGVDSNGNFVVVWTSNGSNYGDLSDSSIQGQRFTSNGSFINSQFQVNTYTTGSQSGCDVGIDNEGDFVVVWHDLNGNYSIQAQRFASDGSYSGSQFQVNEDTSDYKY
ncbi:hypothetical protein ACFL27_06760 [candidate division CSSED10-310 bacterium]|uniref:Uncharacterized protein n=1 Tax=candidate division CSSED10-310 bacterium TaxID=2855610 RepID=A0ABV6YUN4_UNCC1